MITYVNGCSHTRGTKVALGDGKTWPQLLPGTVIDNSKAGQSNQSIIRSTIHDIISAHIPPDKVVIQFTVLERFDLPYHDIGWKTHYPLSDQKHNAQTDGQQLFERYCPVTDAYDHLPNLTRRLLSKELFGNMLLLQTFLKDWDIDFCFLVWPDTVMKSVAYKRLDHDKMIFGVWQHLKRMGHRASFKPDPERNGKIDHHFGPDAHQQIADWIARKEVTGIHSNLFDDKMPIHGYD